VISPCVAFNNHDGSTKSFDYIREHNVALNSLDFIGGRPPIEIDGAAGEGETISLHDGSVIRLHRLADDHDRRDISAATALLERHRARGEVVTGLLYLNDEAVNLHQRLQMTGTPLNALREPELCPGSKALEAINASLR
jgi:2-oxoglutarate ferredoxin oxidoreductase subunit beta